MGSSKSKLVNKLEEAIKIETFNHHRHFVYLINVNVPRFDYNEIKEALKSQEFSSFEKRKINKALRFILDRLREEDKIHLLLFEKAFLPLLAIRNTKIKIKDNTFKAIICDICKL